MSDLHTEKVFSKNSAEAKWYAFGRYYAMFPVSFPYEAVRGLTDVGNTVLDPFCGRGNSLFCAMSQKRPAVGIDINPLAHLYSTSRCNLVESADEIIARLREVSSDITDQDKEAESDFERMAWSPGVLGFLRTARRQLKWSTNNTDRVLMGFVTIHAQDKCNTTGLSNKLPPTIAPSASYSVKWWTKNGMTEPPNNDPVDVLADKIRRRYRYGIPRLSRGIAHEGDARQLLAELEPINASLLITSPPYIDVTDYWNDHWIRLWLLGHPFLRKDWTRSAKHSNQDEYRELLNDVLEASRRHLSADATILIRSDVRKQTSTICKSVLRNVFPNHEIYEHSSEAPRNGESVHHGRGGHRAREVDFLLAGSERAKQWAIAKEFSTQPN